MVRRSLLDPVMLRDSVRAGTKSGPSLGEVMSLMFGVTTCFDDGMRQAGVQALKRTGVGFSGPGYGFALPVEMAEDIVDRARTTDGPWRRCLWRGVKNRQFAWPAVNETSRASGSRWGGIQAKWGLPETVLPPDTSPSLTRVNFDLKRLLIFVGPVSRDLWFDQDLLGEWLNYTAIAEMRAAIELAMIQGASGEGAAGPIGVVGHPATIVVAKDGGQSAGTITSNNIDGVWASIYAGSKERAVWHCNDATLQKIDQLAVSGQFPEALYIPAGLAGNERPLLKGRPLIVSEFCPNIGSPGDLIAVDWSDYFMAYYRPNPMESPLRLTFGPTPTDPNHRGILGLPEGAVEARMSDEFYFTTDSLAFAWKMRADGKPIWTSSITAYSGNKVSFAAVIAQR
jgi:HK97 family phage major capsid protein